MKKPYKRPQLEEYGKIRELTFGATGNAPDFNALSGQMIVQNPKCTNFIPRGGCVRFS